MNNVRIATSWSTAPDAKSAFEQALAVLLGKIEGYPSLLFVYFTELYPAEAILAALDFLPLEVKVHACTSCQGVMTEDGVHGEDGRALALFGIRDGDGAYGVGKSAKADTPRAAAGAALLLALADAGRLGELPDLIWLNAAPGHEEQVLLGIQDVVGIDIPIIGGSAADNGVAGRWQLLTRHGVDNDAVVVSVMFPSCRTACSFQSGYVPSGRRGIATSVSGRVVHEIDHRPAAEVYNHWTGGLLDAVLPDGGNILALTTLAPLGRVSGHVSGHVSGRGGDASYFTLSHPDAVLADGSLRLFTEIEAGQELFLMSGSRDSLIARAARVTEAAIELEAFDSRAVLGAMIVYCAGCMLTVRDRMQQVVDELNQALDRKPFIGIFTFGEQGNLHGGGATHGNLMIPSLVFAD